MEGNEGGKKPNDKNVRIKEINRRRTRKIRRIEIWRGEELRKRHNRKMSGEKGEER